MPLSWGGYEAQCVMHERLYKPSPRQSSQARRPVNELQTLRPWQSLYPICSFTDEATESAEKGRTPLLNVSPGVARCERNLISP